MKRHYVSVVESHGGHDFQLEVNDRLASIQDHGGENISVSFHYGQAQRGADPGGFSMDLVQPRYIAMIHYCVDQSDAEESDV